MEGSHVGVTHSRECPCACRHVGVPCFVSSSPYNQQCVPSSKVSVTATPQSRSGDSTVSTAQFCAGFGLRVFKLQR